MEKRLKRKIFTATAKVSTDRNQAKEKLCKSGELFREISENISEVFWLSSSDYKRILYISPAYEEIWGRTCNSLKKNFNTWVDSIHPLDKERVIDALKKSSHVKHDEEYRIIRPDGSIRWIHHRVFPVKNEKGEVYRIAGIAVDITERKEVEKEFIYRLKLEEALAKVSSLFVSAKNVDFIQLLKILGEAVSVNRAYVFQFRDSGNKIDNIYEWCNDNTKPQIGNMQNIDSSLFSWWIKKLQDNESIIVSDVSQLPEDMDHLKEVFEAQGICSLINVPIIYKEDKLFGFLGFNDTEKCRKWSKNDTRLLRIVSEMITTYFVKKLIEERAKSQQQQLVHTDKITSLGTIAASVAHEINNPNNFIMFNSPILAKIWKDIVPILEEYYRENGDFSLGGLPYLEAKDVTPKLISGIAEGSRRIKIIVAKLKDYVRQKSSKRDSLVHVNNVINSAVDLVQNLIRKHTQNFSVELYRGLPPVRGNYLEIEQVIINIISNACHALSNTSKKVLMRTYFDQKTGNVIIEAVDEGEGIVPENLPKITNPFFTTKQKQGGTGLGLSVSSNIVRDHAGTLTFSSEPEKGTKVTIMLPAIERRK